MGYECYAITNVFLFDMTLTNRIQSFLYSFNACSLKLMLFWEVERILLSK